MQVGVASYSRLQKPEQQSEERAQVSPAKSKLVSGPWRLLVFGYMFILFEIRLTSNATLVNSACCRFTWVKVSFLYLSSILQVVRNNIRCSTATAEQAVAINARAKREVSLNCMLTDLGQVVWDQNKGYFLVKRVLEGMDIREGGRGTT